MNFVGTSIITNISQGVTCIQFTNTQKLKDDCYEIQLTDLEETSPASFSEKLGVEDNTGQ